MMSAPEPFGEEKMAAYPFVTCACGRQFATEDGFQAHFVSLHDAEPDPIENKHNDDEIRKSIGVSS